MRERPPRTDAELALAAGHVNYELKALVDGAELLLGNDPLAVAHWASGLEAMLLHLRNLWEFLFNATDKRYIAAADFLPGWDAGAALASTGMDGSTQGVLDKHLRHLSWERIEDRTGTPEPDWQVPLAGVVATFSVFVHRLPEGLKQHFIAEAVRSVDRIAALPNERWTASTTPAPDATIVAGEQATVVNHHAKD
jgi:hypothetical protein